MKKNPTILFIKHSIKDKSKSFYVSGLLIQKVFNRLGMKVKLFPYKSERFNFIFEFFKALKFIKDIDILYIRVDGSSILEKFSLLKLFNRRLCLIWEIHGDAKEAFWGVNSFKAKYIILKRSFKRKILSRLVSAAVCLCSELKLYSKKELGIKKSFVTPSFVSVSIIKKVLQTRRDKNAINLIMNNKKIFKVLWGGGAWYKWQAIDIVEKVAKKIYQLDKDIIFLIIGSRKWYKFNFYKNILLFDSYPHRDYLYIIKKANLCLALYHKDNFHFSPLKLLEYMALAKPVIATKVGQIKKVIKNKDNGFFTDNSVDDIVQKILFLKKNPHFAHKMAREAQETVFKNYTLEQSVQNYKRIFKKLGIGK